MAYVNPPTFVSTTTATAADVNVLGADIAYLYGVIQGLTFSGCYLKRTANQSIANNTDVLISWDTESYDYGGWYTSGTDIIVPAGAIPAGYTTIAVDLNASLKYASNTTGKRRVQLNLNGAYVKSWTIGGVSGDVTDVQLSHTFPVAAADVITIVGLQTSGGALNMTEGAVTCIRRNAVA